MDELASIVSENLTSLRKEKHLTQQELAALIGYSDKSISKWELGKAIPSVDILLKFAQFYGVTLDYLVTKGSTTKSSPEKESDRNKTNKIVIMAMAATFVLFAATAIYINSLITKTEPSMWIAFLYGIPAAAFIDALLDLKFFHRNTALWVLLSVVTWGLLFAVSMNFFFYLNQNIFFILLVGIPVQIGFILFSQVK